jgi:hypothetical protein
MPLGVKYDTKAEAMPAAFISMADPMAAAATAAITEVGMLAKTGGRASIAAAGFSTRWQNAYRLTIYPKRGKLSIDAAAYLKHNIPYSLVFEQGAVIRGRPMLFIPLSTTPRKLGTRRLTPKLYQREIGPLFTIKRLGKPPLLAAKIRVSKTFSGKPTLSQLKRGVAAGGRGRIISKPLFVGVSQVSLSKRFNVLGAARAASSQLAQRFYNHLKTD